MRYRNLYPHVDVMVMNTEYIITLVHFVIEYLVLIQVYTQVK